MTDAKARVEGHSTVEDRQGCPLVVHYWADLQSVHGLRCCGNITRTRNVSEYMLVVALALCLVLLFNVTFSDNVS